MTDNTFIYYSVTTEKINSINSLLNVLNTMQLFTSVEVKKLPLFLGQHKLLSSIEKKIHD